MQTVAVHGRNHSIAGLGRKRDIAAPVDTSDVCYFAAAPLDIVLIRLLV